MALIGAETRAVLLVGGKGTRLRPIISAIAKPMATIGDRPFLELLVRQLSCQGIRRLVMCTGYLSREIEDEFGDGHTRGVEIEYSKEPEPLGTAGAIKFAEPFLRGVSIFLVMNGDSFIEMDLRELLRFHRESGGLASMAVLRMKNKKRYGTVQMDAKGRVYGFAEKISVESGGFVNAGVYVFNREIFEHIPEGPASLEKDIFPKLLAYGVYASVQGGVFIDIGTPEDYVRAQELNARLHEAACRSQEPRSSE
jgi:NDP-sugar pyrophosphorylase family protein